MASIEEAPIVPHVKRFTFIWIRHGTKAYSNSKGPMGSYNHDPPLISDAGIIEKAKELIDLYGKPVSCITSPYLRCRQTVQLLLSSCTNVPVIIDTSISEFLGFQKNENPFPDVDPSTIESLKNSTFEFLPSLGESRRDLYKRVKLHLKSMTIDRYNPKSGVSELYDTPSGTYWIVTHGIVINTIFKQLLKKKYIRCQKANYAYPKTLDAICIDGYENSNSVFLKILPA